MHFITAVTTSVFYLTRKTDPLDPQTERFVFAAVISFLSLFCQLAYVDN
jgi:hypothetical protein